MGSLIYLEGPMTPMTIINMVEEDSSMRDGCKEHRYSAKDERMKDQERCDRGRINRRDDDDDKNISEKDGRRTKDDAYRDADGYKARRSAKGDRREGASS